MSPLEGEGMQLWPDSRWFCHKNPLCLERYPLFVSGLRSPSRCLAVWWARRRWRIDSTDACYRLSISKSRTLRRLNSHGLR